MSEFTSIISNFVAEVISAALTVASEGEGSEQQVAQQARRSASYKPNIRITGTIFALILRHAEFDRICPHRMNYLTIGMMRMTRFLMRMSWMNLNLGTATTLMVGNTTGSMMARQAQP